MTKTEFSKACRRWKKNLESRRRSDFRRGPYKEFDGAISYWQSAEDVTRIEVLTELQDREQIRSALKALGLPLGRSLWKRVRRPC